MHLGLTYQAVNLFRLSHTMSDLLEICVTHPRVGIKVG